MNRLLPLLCCFALVLAAGCARYVVRGSDYGVVAIPSNNNMWPMRHQDKAHELMTQHFPEGYIIEHEEETVVGQTVNVDQTSESTEIVKKGPFSIDIGNSSTTETISDDTEWRIYYRRR